MSKYRAVIDVMSKYRAFIDEYRLFDRMPIRTITQEFNSFSEAYQWIESYPPLSEKFSNKYYHNKRISLITKNNEQ